MIAARGGPHNRACQASQRTAANFHTHARLQALFRADCGSRVDQAMNLPEIVPRISDIYAAIPSMTGKMELEYEGEQIGAQRIAKDLIKRAAGEIFEGYFVGIDFAKTVAWFDEGNNLRLADTASAEECMLLLESAPELIETALIPFDFNRQDQAQTIAACEFALEGLYAENKISRNEEGGYTAVTKAKKDRRGMIYDDLTETGRYS